MAIDISVEDVQAIVCLILAPVFIFYGYRFHKFILVITGAAFGGYFAFYFITILEDNWLGQISVTAKYIIIAILALCTGILMVKLTKFSVFLLGAVGGAFVGNIAITFILANWIDDSDLPDNVEYYKLAALAICSILMGVFTLKLFHKIFVRLLTSMIGGYLFIGGADYGLYKFGYTDEVQFAPNVFFSSNPAEFRCSSDYKCWIILGVWVLLTLLGTFVQYRKRELEEHDSDFDSLEEVIVIDRREVSYSDSLNEAPPKKRRGSKRNKRRGSKNMGERRSSKGRKELGERRGSKRGRRKSKDLGKRRNSKRRNSKHRKSKRGVQMMEHV